MYLWRIFRNHLSALFVGEVVRLAVEGRLDRGIPFDPLVHLLETDRAVALQSQTRLRLPPLTGSGRRRQPPTIQDSVGGRNVTIQFNPAANTLRVVEADEGVSWMYSFWFAWYAFRPHTDVLQPHSGR